MAWIVTQYALTALVVGVVVTIGCFWLFALLVRRFGVTLQSAVSAEFALEGPGRYP